MGRGKSNYYIYITDIPAAKCGRPCPLKLNKPLRGQAASELRRYTAFVLLPLRSLLPPSTAPPLDTLRLIETPEGIELRLRLAGPMVRALAWVIDGLIKYSVLIALSIALASAGSAGVGLLLLAWFLIEWFYPVLFEVWRDGATPGKRSLRIKVVNDNGTPVDLARSVIRNLLRAVDFLPLFYGFGLFSTLLTRDFKRLGDLAAGTLVIYAESARPPLALPPGPAHPPIEGLTLQEKRLLIDLAARHSELNPERQRELAERLTPLTGKQGSEAVEELAAQARWLLGSGS